MTSQMLLYAGSALTALWGLAHLLPTRSIVRGSAKPTLDNEHIITMEWILEGVALIGMGARGDGDCHRHDQCSIAIGLFALRHRTHRLCRRLSFHRFQGEVIPFRLCPFIFTAAAILILLGGVLR